jgi:hypothetical protein
MADITMCRDKGCNKKNTCFRYKAKPNPHRQSYFSLKSINEDDFVCDYYWEVDDIDKLNNIHGD